MLARGGHDRDLTTHDIDSVPEFADYATCSQPGGEIALKGTPAEVFAAAELIAASNIKPPVLAELFARLRERDASAPRPALTVEEAAEALAALEGGASASAARQRLRRAPSRARRTARPTARAASRSSSVGANFTVKSLDRHLEADLLEPRGHLLRRPARPAVAAEGAADLVLGLEAREVLQVAGGAVEHAVVQRGRAEEQRARVEAGARVTSRDGRDGEVEELARRRPPRRRRRRCARASMSVEPHIVQYATTSLS